MLHQLFGSLQQQLKVFKDGALDHSELSLGRLLILAGPEWEGHISRGSVALISWKQLQVYYEPLGLVKAQIFRLCMRTIKVSYVSQLMEPSPEDIYEGPNMAKCECGLEMRTKFKYNYSTCTEKCLTC